MERNPDPVTPDVTRLREHAIVQAYLNAKLEVLKSPYQTELLTFKISPHDVSESDFLREVAWVILSSGMAEKVVRRKFPEISKCFLEWQSASCISEYAEYCVASALLHFGHEGKITAIAKVARQLSAVPSFEDYRQKLLQDPIHELQVFPYIGPVTAFHVAKNIGFPVAKADRHLQRLAQANGFRSVTEFCETISVFLGEDIRLVDSVLWRFATLHEDYVFRFSALCHATICRTD